MEITVRKATFSDLPDIQALSQLLFEKEYAEFDNTLNLDWTYTPEGTEFFKEILTDDDSCVCVALSDDKIIGYVSGFATKETAGESVSWRKIGRLAALGNIIISDDYRGKGVGTKLNEYFVNWCKEKGCKRINVLVSSDNKQALKFYEKEGFHVYDIVLEKEL